MVSVIFFTAKVLLVLSVLVQIAFASMSGVQWNRILRSELIALFSLKGGCFDVLIDSS